MKKLVVPIGLSASDSKILQHAIAIAKAYKGVIYLVHSETCNEGVNNKDDNEQEYVAESHQLNELANTIRAEDIETHAIIMEGVTAAAILNEINNVNADLVVMGSHGHGAIVGALLGSVSQEVVKHAGIPVLLVPVNN